MKTVMSIFCVLVFSVSQGYAGESFFAKTSKEMVDQLSVQPKLPGRTRSLQTGDVHSTEQRRGIIIREKIEPGSEPGATVTESIIISRENTQPHVNLKIEFDFDSYTIRPGSFPLLAELGDALKTAKLRPYRFAIIGHTDTDGDEKYNLNLSYRRSLAVKYFLQNNFDLPGDHLIVFGYGENIPIATNATTEGRQKNRRVEIVRYSMM